MFFPSKIQQENKRVFILLAYYFHLKYNKKIPTNLKIKTLPFRKLIVYTI